MLEGPMSVGGRFDTFFVSIFPSSVRTHAVIHFLHRRRLRAYAKERTICDKGLMKLRCKERTGEKGSLYWVIPVPQLLTFTGA